MPSFSSRALLACLLLIFFAGCTDKGLGTETVGRHVRSAIGRSVDVIPSSQRKDRPVFGGPALDGTRVTSSSLLGHVAVVNFWASWCGPCRSEQKALEQSFEAHRAQGVRFVGVNFREPDKAAALAYINEFHVTYPSIWNPDSSLAQPFRIFAPPSTFVLDRQGRIAARILGATTSESDLNAVIDQVLAS